MVNEYRSRVKKEIENNSIDNLRDSLRDVDFVNLIISDDFDYIKLIYNHFKSSISNLEQEIFRAVINYACEDEPNSTGIQCLKLLSNTNFKFTISDSNDIYYICQISGNYKLFDILIDLDTDINWGDVLRESCNFIELEAVTTILDKISYSESEINSAFDRLINSNALGSGNNNKNQNHLIYIFISQLNADINLKTNYDRGCIYLDCLCNAPNAAKYFYIEKFDILNIENDDFWNEFIKGKLANPRRKRKYTCAFKDLKHSGLNLSYLVSTFRKLGKLDLLNELIEDID